MVGPARETGNFLALDREILAVEIGEYLAVLSAGAYGFAMASHYNLRPRACEVLMKRNTYRAIRERTILTSSGKTFPTGTLAEHLHGWVE